MTDLKNLIGKKGCRKCRAYVSLLARVLEDTARNQYMLGREEWFETWQKAVGARYAEGLLRHGSVDGEVYADLRPPPNVDPAKWKPEDKLSRNLEGGKP